jgi:hypothetical protein
MTNKPNIYAKKLRVLLVEAYGGQCCICKAVSDLQFAHVKPTPISVKHRGRGRKERIYDVLKNPLNYKLTCKEHNQTVEEISL